MRYIDLHVHSTYSDGSFTPTELLKLALQANLAAFALTDHDTTEGFDELKAAADEYNRGVSGDRKIEVIPGVEISAAYKTGDIHILGLLVDPHNDTLVKMMGDAKAERDRRNEKMAENLRNAGLDISIKAIREKSPDSIITRAHFAKYMVENHMVHSYADAFTYYLGDKTPYYVARKFTSPETAIKCTLAAGGVPVLAHPIIYHLEPSELNNLIDKLISYGLRGIETIYSSNTLDEEAAIRAIAKEKGLLMTGGSDFHGAPKPSISIGSGRGNLKVPYELLTILRNSRD
jgi:predicted metal-dependent phosphoesterase TrpH